MVRIHIQNDDCWNVQTMDTKYSVIIPAYNEETTIGTVIAEILATCPAFHESIIVVDDGSTDKTSDVARSAGAIVIRHNKNRGYGAALKTGIKYAKSEYVVLIDGDGQHNPQDLPKFLEATYGYDIIVGVRSPGFDSPVTRKPGKWFINKLANYLSQMKIPDLFCGFRLLRKDIILKYLHLCPNGFSFSTTSTLIFINCGYNVGFVPITGRKRRAGSTSKVSIKTGFDTILLVLRTMMLFNPLRIFIPISISCLAMGVIVGLYYYINGVGVTGTALILIMTGILLFFFGLLSDQIAEIRKEMYD